jgi:hypothetical protein
MDDRNERSTEGASLAAVEAPIEPAGPPYGDEPDDVEESSELELAPVSDVPVRHSSASPMLWIAGGLLIGVAVTLALTQLLPKQNARQGNVASRNLPVNQQTSTTPPNQGPPTHKPADDPIKQPGTTGTTADAGTQPPNAVPPFDPMNQQLTIPNREIDTSGKFSGPIIPGIPLRTGPAEGTKPKEGSQAVAGQQPAKGDKPGGKEAAPAVAAKGSVQLLTVTAAVASPSDVRGSLSSWARTAGGSAQSFKGYDEKTENVLDGVVVFVPEEKLEAFLAFARSLGVGPVDETWVGTPGARRSRLTSQAETQAAALRKKKDELLEQFYEDSSQVRHTTEGIEAVSASIGNLRPPKSTDNLEAIKVVLLRR